MKPIIIWTYHRVLPTEGSSAVTAAIFEEQIKSLICSGYEFIDTSKLNDIFTGKLDPGKRKFTVITFDDGWADNLIWATPILKKYSIKAVMAVNTALVNPIDRVHKLSAENYEVIPSKEALALAANENIFDSFLTWSELKELKESGVWDIQAHGNSHFGCYHDITKIRGFYPDYQHWTMQYALGCKPFEGAPRAEFQSILAMRRTRLSSDFISTMKNASTNEVRKTICTEFSKPIEYLESEEEFRERIRGDMMLCKKYLKEKLDIEPIAMFWPWGHYSPESIKAATECGLELIFTMNKDVLKSPVGTTTIPRIAAPASLLRFKKQMRVFTNPVLKIIRDIFSKK